MLENEKVLHVDWKLSSETLKLETNKNCLFFGKVHFVTMMKNLNLEDWKEDEQH